MTNNILLKSRIGLPRFSHLLHYHLEKSAGLGLVTRIEAATSYISLIGDQLTLRYLNESGLHSIFSPQIVAKVPYSDYVEHSVDVAPPGFYSIHGDDVIFPNNIFARCERLLSFTILRDPVDRFKSLVRYMFRRGMATSRDDLYSQIRDKPNKFVDYMTRYFASGSYLEPTISTDLVDEAYSNLSNLDIILPQSNSPLIKRC